MGALREGSTLWARYRNKYKVFFMTECDCDKKLPGIRMVKGNDLTVVALASVYDADSGAYIAFNLGVCTGVTMRLVRSFNRIEAKNISVDGDEVSATFAGSTLTTGTYGVEILFSKDGQDGRLFENDLFAIVTDSGDASIDTAAGGGNGQGYNITVDIKSRTLRVGQVSGITDYNLLENRPSIGGVTLEGNKRPSDLEMYSKEEADEKFQTKESAAEADKRVQGMLDGKVDKEPGKGLSANDLTDERAGKVDMLAKDGRANEHLNGAGTYSRPVRQGYGVSVADDNTVSVDPQVIARQSDVANVAADLAAQKAKEQGDIDRANAAISKEETDRKDAVAALQSLIDILNSDSNVDGSVSKTVADAIARVVAGAPEDLDTLKEIADYIASDKTGAAEMAAAISQLQTLTEEHTSDIGRNAAGVAENKAGVAANASDITELKRYNDGTEARIKSLEDGKAATKYVDVKNLTVAEAIVSLAARLDALEGSRGLLGDATAVTVDVRGLTRCRYPLVMLGHGVPAEANVPANLPDGLPWDGVPAFAGQQYVNLDAASGGLYYASGVDSVADWKQA